MATKVEIGHDMPEAKVDSLPPPGPRYTSDYQKAFHYRGKLFSSTANRLRNLCHQQSSELENSNLHYDAFQRTSGETSDRPPSQTRIRSHSSPKLHRPRRIQSAKGRLEKRQDPHPSKTQLEKSGSQVSVVDINLNVDIPKQSPSTKRPSSPIANILLKQEVSSEKSASRPCSRPSSAKASIGRQTPVETGKDDGVRPSVYGLRLKRQVFGSDPGIFSGSLPDKNCPYLFDETKKENENSNENLRPMPVCLEPLRPWLTTDISHDVIGIDPESCLVFLSGCFDNLPEVPSSQSDEDVLMCRGELPPEKPLPPKKYSHPFYERKLSTEWECNHRSPPLKKICTEDGIIVHTRYEGKRTADIVRKEITELENLMLGIGSYDSECMMVQYQADITRLREMIDHTLEKVPDRIKNPPEPPDTFGLRKFCREHDAVIKQIRVQHNLCVQELAMLESGMDLDETQKYFSRQRLQVRVPTISS